MNFDTEIAARYAAEKLDLLLARATRDSTAVITQNDIPSAVTYFAKLRDIVKDLAAKTAALQKHVDTLSYELLPTMFGNQDVKSIKVEGVGNVTINDRWSASMLKKDEALAWLRETGNQGIIIETVNAQTLGAFAKDEAHHQRPLPSEIFKVSQTPYVSIRQG